MRHMYSHPGEYRKIFLANYLCIGFVPGGNYVIIVGPTVISEEISLFSSRSSEDIFLVLGLREGSQN